MATSQKLGIIIASGINGIVTSVWSLPSALARHGVFPYIVRLYRLRIMPEHKPRPAIAIRDLESLNDLRQLEALEREVWQLADLDITPLTLIIAAKAAGSILLGAFDGSRLAGFVFGFLGVEHGRAIIHSHMLAVHSGYRDLDLGFKLKLAQRDRALAMRVSGLPIHEVTWTFDPLQSRNAHLNFSKLGVVSDSYKVDFYGPETSSVLHRNSTDRLWVRWPIASRRARDRSEGKTNHAEVLEALASIQPLVRFDGDGRPARSDLDDALKRQRIVIEIPGEILAIEQTNPKLAREWRQATRWAFVEALKTGFFVAEFCRAVRGQQGPGAYLLEKGTIEEYVPEMHRS